MAKPSKRQQKIKESLGERTQAPIDEVLDILKYAGTAKFDESVDVAVNLGIDSRKSDQNVRGSTVLPHGTGKTVRVAVFTSAANADAAKGRVSSSGALELMLPSLLCPSLRFTKDPTESPTMHPNPRVHPIVNAVAEPPPK